MYPLGITFILVGLKIVFIQTKILKILVKGVSTAAVKEVKVLQNIFL